MLILKNDADQTENILMAVQGSQSQSHFLFEAILLALLFSLLSHVQPANAQIIVDGQNLDKIDTKYLEIMISRRVMTQEIQVLIDYGQYIDYHREFEQRIETPRGERIQFRSIVQTLNLMDENDWEYLQTYPAHTNNYERLHYLFRRKEDSKH